MPHLQRRARAGFTLVEMLITMTLLTIVLGSVTGMVTRTQRDYVRQREAVRLQENVRTAEMLLTRLLRTSTVDPLNLNLGSIVVDPLAHGQFDNIRLRSDFNPPDGDVADPLEDALIYTSQDTLYVRWRAGALPQPVAFPVRKVLFEYFAVDNTPITTQALVASAAKAKFTVTVPEEPGASAIKERVTWVHFRN